MRESVAEIGRKVGRVKREKRKRKNDERERERVRDVRSGIGYRRERLLKIHC